MFVAAIAFYFIFSHRPYIDRAAAQVPCLDSCLRTMDIRDIYGDVKENFVDPIPVPRLPNRLPGRWNRVKGEPEEKEDVPLLSVERQIDQTREREEGRRSDASNLEREGRGMESLMVLTLRNEVPIERSNNVGDSLNQSETNSVEEEEREDHSSYVSNSSSTDSGSSSGSHVRERKQVSDSNS